MARKASDPSFQFWFDEKYYTVQGAKSMLSGTADDIATLRSEYTRMRDVAQKRVKRLGESFPESKAYTQHQTGFPKLRDISPQDLPYAFSELSKFVRAKTSTVTGQRIAQEKTMATLNKAIGASVPSDDEDEDEDDGSPTQPQAGVTKENYWRVIKILERARKNKATYGSDKIVTLAEETLGLSKRQFKVILNNLDKIAPNADDFQESLQDYMARHNLKGYRQVAMSKFIKEAGW